MLKRRRGCPIKTSEWTDERLEEVTLELEREGKYRPDSKSFPSADYPHGMCSPSSRVFGERFHSDQRAAWDKVFRDELQEKSAWLPPSHSGFLREATAAGFIRRRPSNLRESIARNLVESSTLDAFPTKFRMTAFLISRGVSETGEDAPGDFIFPKTHFTWRDFLHYQPKVDRLILSAKRNYFKHNMFISEESGLTLWARFDAPLNGLTRKQRSALEIFLMDEESTSLEDSARRLKISRATFRDRVNGAISLNATIFSREEEKRNT